MSDFRTDLTDEICPDVCCCDPQIVESLVLILDLFVIDIKDWFIGNYIENWEEFFQTVSYNERLNLFQRIKEIEKEVEKLIPHPIR